MNRSSLGRVGRWPFPGRVCSGLVHAPGLPMIWTVGPRPRQGDPGAGAPSLPTGAICVPVRLPRRRRTDWVGIRTANLPPPRISQVAHRLRGALPAADNRGEAEGTTNQETVVIMSGSGSSSPAQFESSRRPLSWTGCERKVRTLHSDASEDLDREQSRRLYSLELSASRHAGTSPRHLLEQAKQVLQ